ncbi:MAG: LysR family transcriptional regulator [Bacteriovoracaceae bacterium]
MKISHLGLQAFYQTATTLNITLAAKQLGLTQSALSQRISALESELEVTLFLREPKGLLLTEVGERLLRFSQMNQKVEEELLLELQGSKTELAGTIRIAAYSSILRSVILPTMSEFLLKYPNIQVHFQAYETGELENVLKRASADIIIMDYEWDKKGIAKKLLGFEEYVVIAGTKIPTGSKSRDDTYLDHDAGDMTTENFFKANTNAPKKWKRSFMGDVYGIIDGVESGLGRAVMSKHLINENKKIKIVKSMKSIKRPVCMYYYEQPYYSRLMKEVIQVLENEITPF